jgi:hypothetical protein
MNQRFNEEGIVNSREDRENVYGMNQIDSAEN